MILANWASIIHSFLVILIYKKRVNQKELDSQIDRRVVQDQSIVDGHLKLN